MYRYVHLGKRWDLEIVARRWCHRWFDPLSVHVALDLGVRGVGFEAGVTTGRKEAGFRVDVNLCERLDGSHE